MKTRRQKRLAFLVERHKDAESKFMGESVVDLTREELLAVLAELSHSHTRLMNDVGKGKE